MHLFTYIWYRHTPVVAEAVVAVVVDVAGVDVAAVDVDGRS